MYVPDCTCVCTRNTKIHVRGCADKTMYHPLTLAHTHTHTHRFATGGQGDDCGLVNIWNMAPVRSETDQSNASIPKSLCEMTNHLGCVNSVRWSVDGKWLASGGDDAIVMIWQIKYQGIVKSSFGGTNHEQWGCVNMLRGHNGDILGVAWSHDQKYLASCSVDNTIIIWNAKDLPQKVASISGHQGLVKGLTWDPVGKYIASQSDDRSVRIWRTNDWKEVKQVTEPFHKCGGTTHVLRLSWSPDGKFIVTAHALNNDGPTAQIIERGDWKTGIDFVGHRKAVEVVCFNPHLFMNKEGTDNHGCIALGSRDRSLSVWLTSLKRPLVVIHDLFTDSILDLSWSKSGYELMVCSTDGTVAYIHFTKKELGAKVSEQGLDDIFMTTYGTKRAANKKNANTSTVLIEDPTMLQLVKSEQDCLTSTPLKMKTESGSALNKSVEMVSTSAPAPSVTKQVETKTSDGRRRITPITLTSQPSSLSGAPLPFTSFSPKQNKGVTMETSPPENSAPTSHTGDVSVPIKSPPPKPIQFQPLSPRSSTPEKATKNFKEKEEHATKKRKADDSVSALPKAKKLKRAAKTGTTTVVETTKPSLPQRASSVSGVSKMMLPVPEVENVLSTVISRGIQDKDSTVVEIENSMSSSKYHIVCKRNDSVLWSNSLACPVLLAGGNSLVTCALCNDKSVYIFSTKSGRMLLARFYLSSLPHAIHVESHHILIVGSNATVSVWNVQSFKAIVKEANIAHFLQDGKKTLELENVELTTNGVPAITIKGTTYFYHMDMGTWQEACNRVDSEIHLTDTPVGTSLDTNAPLRAIQKTRNKMRTDSVGQMLSTLRSASSQSTTLMYLENQISRSLCLQSPLEYTHWCMAYVRYLVKEEREERLREFCGQFTSPAGGDGGRVLGVAKQSMLRDFLPIIAGNARLQRLYCELRDSGT